MKKIILLVYIFISIASFAQQNFNTKKGIVAEGYDVVAYFSNQAVKGNKKHTTIHRGASFLFSSQKNVEVFTANPKKFIPQFGGFCAYAMGTSGKKVSIDPETFEIREGKLFLFYNSWGTNTFIKWTQQNPKKLVKKAAKNWLKLANK
tara:strand:+ start:1863 stop:2306 length:444 start_codon:yes stop_codon:yes gene_type:complete